MLHPIQQSQEAIRRHTHDEKWGCITTNNTPANITMKKSPSPVKGQTRTSSG